MSAEATKAPDLIRDAAERFRRDTAKHVLTVLRDDGLYRHLRFRQPDRGTYWFDLTTWPGALAITGDMNGYVFRRMEDMFEFFRVASGWNSNTINPGYWAEKLVAPEPRAVRTFSDDKFRQVVMEHATDAEDEHPGLVDAVGLRIFVDYDCSYEENAREALDAFEHGKFRFEDTWEWNFSDFDWAYLWCCHAIQWGIGQYDAARQLEAVA